MKTHFILPSLVFLCTPPASACDSAQAPDSVRSFQSMHTDSTKMWYTKHDTVKVPTPTPPPAAVCDTDVSQLQFYGNFEQPTPYDTWGLGEIIKTSEPWRLTTITDPVRECGQVARIELRETDSLAGGNKRAELKLQVTGAAGGNGGVPVPTGYSPIGHLGSEVWWGFSVYVPDSFVFETGTPSPAETIMQTAQAGRSPALEIQIDRGDFKIYNRNGTGTAVTIVSTTTLPITRGVWVDWVFHAKWSAASTGVLEIWKDSVKVVSRLANANTYTDWDTFSTQRYFKMGDYKWSWLKYPGVSIVDTRVLWFDAVRLTDGAHGSYAIVAPR